MKIADVLRQDDFIFAVDSFIDEFKRSDNKYNMISEEPFVEYDDKTNLCILAAVAHKLSNDFKINVPGWVNKSFYTMPFPVFSFNTKNEEFQKYLLENTPAEFSCRNLFLGEDVIERV